MKRPQLAVATFVAATMLTLLLTGCTSGQSDNGPAASNPKGEKTVQYTCSMHPEVVQDKPGDCPKCGMKLVEKH